MSRVVGSRFEVYELLGEGGFAHVFRGWDRRGQDEVAIKVLKPSAAEPWIRERFLSEGDALAPIRHRHIVRLLGTGEDQGLPYLVMELVRGETLRAKLASNNRLPPREAARLLRGLCSAIDYLHAAGLVHRDVTAGNVMLERSGQEAEERLVLMDLGIVRWLDRPDFTRRHIIGTPTYMPPEQARREEVNPPGDIYSLGALAFHMFAGRPPFIGDVIEVLYGHTKLPPPPLREFCPDLPAGIEAAIAWALEKAPTARPPTAIALCEAIERALSPRQSSPPPPPPKSRRIIATGPSRLRVMTLTRRDRAGGGDGSSSIVPFDGPASLVSTGDGCLYVSDTRTRRIRRVDPKGRVSTVAVLGPQPGASRVVPGTFEADKGVYSWYAIGHVAVDDDGLIYVSESGWVNYARAQTAFANVGQGYGFARISTITADGRISTLTESRSIESEVEYRAIALSPQGHLYLALTEEFVEVFKNRNPDTCIVTVDRSGTRIPVEGGSWRPNPKAISVDRSGNALVNGLVPVALAVGSDRALFVGTATHGDRRGPCIFRIAPSGKVTVIAGGAGDGHVDGHGEEAQFGRIADLALDRDGNVLVADADNHCIRHVTMGGYVTTLAGSGVPGVRDGEAALAQFRGPAGVAVGSNGAIYVADAGNNRVRVIRSSAR